MQTRFQVGDKAYYPVHGIAEVVALEKREIGPQTTAVYVLRIVDSGMKIMVPTGNADAVGLRPIMSTSDVGEVFSILRSSEMTSDRPIASGHCLDTISIARVKTAPSVNSWPPAAPS